MIVFDNLSVSFGGAPVLAGCSFSINAGEHAALMGPSGCGKTTLLRCAAGLQAPDSGSVSVGGTVSFAFQEPRLFPWMTARQNIELVCPGGADGWLQKFELADAADKFPSELSGGMRQRLNLCRALAYGGDVLLLDEPFKGLDAELRREIAALVRREWAERTLLLVTHDPEDVAPGDTLYVYRDGGFVPKTGDRA